MLENKYLPVFLIESNFIEMIFTWAAGKTNPHMNGRTVTTEWNLFMVSKRNVFRMFVTWKTAGTKMNISNIK